MEPLSPQSTPHPPPQKLSKSHQLSLILNMARSQELRAYKHLKLEPLNVLNVVSVLLSCHRGPCLLNRTIPWATLSIETFKILVLLTEVSPTTDAPVLSIFYGNGKIFPLPVFPWFLMVFQKVLTFSSDCNQHQQCWRF